ncbi:unnamed protein product, partial [Brenthis ino]
MFKQVIFAALLAVVAAKPGIHSVAYPAPIVAAPAFAYSAPYAAYTAPAVAAYSAAYTAPVAAAYTAPVAAAYSPFAYSAPIVSAAYKTPVLLK